MSDQKNENVVDVTAETPATETTEAVAPEMTDAEKEAKRAEIMKEIEELEKTLPSNIKVIKIDDENFLKQFKDLSLTYNASLNLFKEMCKDSSVTDSPLVRNAYNTYIDLYKKYETVKEDFKDNVVMKNFPTALNFDLNFNTGITLVTLPEENQQPGANATPMPNAPEGSE